MIFAIGRALSTGPTEIAESKFRFDAKSGNGCLVAHQFRAVRNRRGRVGQASGSLPARQGIGAIPISSTRARRPVTPRRVSTSRESIRDVGAAGPGRDPRVSDDDQIVGQRPDIGQPVDGQAMRAKG